MKRTKRRPGPEPASRWLGAGLVSALLAASPGSAQGAQVTVDFNGYRDGVVLRDQFALLGLRLPPHESGGPYAEDAGDLDFLLDSPPNLLSISPLAPIGVPSQVHASVGTYVFDFVDPTNLFAPSFTDRFEAVLVFVDKGQTILTALDASGAVLDQEILTRSSFDLFDIDRMAVEAPGIRRVTLTTPPEGTLGALVDTIAFDLPAILPVRPIDILVEGPRRHSISLGGVRVLVTILSEPGLEPAALDATHVLFEEITPSAFAHADRNGDHVPDLILRFPTSALTGLERGRTTVTLKAVDPEGTPLLGSDRIFVVGRPRRPLP